MATISMQGAYGRKYPTKESALKDWEGGKDFTILSIIPPERTGTYISKNDFHKYSNAGSVAQVKLSDGVYTIVDRKD